MSDADEDDNASTVEEQAPLMLWKSFEKYGGLNDDDEAVSFQSGLNVHRPIYQIEDLNRDTEYAKPHTTYKERISRKLRSIKPKKCLYHTIPAAKWVPDYQWRRNFFSDIISGITVAIMHIPQGMAYGLLGGVPPVVGIYMAVFPVLIYFFFGTSRHVSIGTFAIVCLMTGKVVNQHASYDYLQNGSVVNHTVHASDEPMIEEGIYSNVEVAITVTLAVALIQILMYFLRLGIVSTLLSDTLINGFTCASAFHVVATQLRDLLGVKMHKRRGYFQFPLTLFDIARSIPESNPYAVAISVITIAVLFVNNECFKVGTISRRSILTLLFIATNFKMSVITIAVLFVNNECFKPMLAKKTRMPFPIELTAVVLGTALSLIFDFETLYNISTVGKIPTGFPQPTLPSLTLMPNILFDAFVITMVSYTITMSMALIFARKLAYEVNANQELLALGLSNVCGSFFMCMPVTASLSRSMIQQSVGGVTQIASLVSLSILVVVLLWIGPFFENLPRAVLASVIVVALKGMILQFRSIVKYAQLSQWDALVWVVTFFVTLFIDISIGLGIGVFVSLLSVFVQGYKPYTCLLGVVPGTDLYLDVKRYGKAHEITGIKMFRYSGGLSFASRGAFKETLSKKIGFEPSSLLRKRKKLEQMGKITESGSLTQFDDISIKCVILDFSALTFVDPAGVDFLRNLNGDLSKLGIEMYIAACSGPVYEKFMKCDHHQKIESQFMIFPTLHDAVIFAKSTIFRIEKHT